MDIDVFSAKDLPTVFRVLRTVMPLTLAQARARIGLLPKLAS